MTWHVDAMTAAHYSVGATDAADAASVEAHLMACDECRTVMNAYADDAVLAAVWADVNDTLDAVHLGWIERALRAVGCSDVTSRIVAATTRARWAYVFVVAFNVFVAFASAQSVDSDAVFLVFLLLAPLGPLVAVAGAFGGWADPCHAVLRTVPTSTLRLTLVRTVAGVVPALVLTAAAVPWLADRGWLAVGWLLPALALAVVTLALSTWIDVERAAHRRGRCVGRAARRAAPAGARPAGRLRRAGPDPVGGRRRGRRRSSSSHANRSSTTGSCDERTRRDPRADQELWAVTGRRPASTSTSGPASSACSARTAPARRRCCGSSPRRWRRRRAPSAFSATIPGSAEGRLAIRRTLGYVPQEVGLYETFTVFDFIDYIAILKEHVDRAARRVEVRRVIDAVDLGDVRSKRIRALSGGMRRRVALAQSLLGDPQLLVLDEPTVGLDPEQRLRFRQIVSQHAERRCVILSTHMTEDVEALCDRVIVMDRGQIVFDGTPASLAAIAAGHVWVADEPDPRAMVSWRTGDGRHRHVGDAPPGADLIPPTVQDGYLVLNGEVPEERVA